MKPRILSLLAALTLSVTAAAARADEPASAVVKAATGIENRVPVGEATTFKAGERVFVWSEVKGADGKTVEHVWKRDGREINHARLPAHAKVWKTNSRIPRAAAGSYEVDVVVDGNVLGTARFKVE